MLIGRGEELKRVEALIAAARSGSGGALAIHGEPGIGKTTVLQWARSHAEGFEVLGATGVESEADLAFAALGELLRPVLGRRERLASAQRHVLEGALALGPPVASDRFAAYAGAFALLEEVSSRAPLVILIDDAHWLDAPSAEALAFVARRVEDLPVVILMAFRSGEGLDLSSSLGEPLALPPLGERDARELLAQGAGSSLAPAVAGRILAVAGGNPLALVELPRSLTPEEWLGRVPLPEPLRVGEIVATAFRRRLDGLDAATRQGLVVAAAGGDDAVETVLRACERLGATQEDLERAEATGILTIEPGRIAFAHPLLRAVALECAAPGELRKVHRALAEAIAGERGLERRAWHLARGTVGSDDGAAQALEEAANTAASRTAYSSAADAMVRAAGLSSDPDERARRLLQGAGLAHVAGRMPMSAGLLEEASGFVQNPGLAAEIDHLRGMVLIYTGPTEMGVRVLFDNADRVAVHSPARAALMLADSSMAWGMAGHPAMCIVSCERAQRLGPLPAEVQAKVDVAMVNSLMFVGRGREARARATGLDEVVAGFDPVSGDHQAVVCGVVVHMYLGAFAVAEREIDRAVRQCRDAGALGPLAFFLATGADLAFRRSNWAEGLAAAQEAAQIAEETGQVPIASYALAVLARLEGACGQDEACRDHLAGSAHLAALSGSTALDVWNGHGRGLLALSRGRLDETIDVLEEVAVMWRREEVRCPDAVPWRHDLIEAYARADRVVDARRHLRELTEEASLATSVSVQALRSRCRGLIADDYPRHFDEALVLHAEVTIPFDEARTRLLYGERLRRDRRRARARDQLTRALATFEALGALPWAERARGELAATGARIAPAATPAMTRLTPRELQVALAVARGATNREAASALFLSEKTVERHLSSTYAKLGLRSRSELARLLAHHEEPGSPM